MEELSATLPEPVANLFGYGVALHSGSVLVGNKGSALRLDYGLVGDTVNEAARIAKAAEACALAGSVAEGVTVSMDIEQLIYEAGRLQDAVSLLNRLSRE